jgi:hypothetical protein
VVTVANKHTGTCTLVHVRDCEWNSGNISNMQPTRPSGHGQWSSCLQHNSNNSLLDECMAVCIWYLHKSGINTFISRYKSASAVVAMQFTSQTHSLDSLVYLAGAMCVRNTQCDRRWLLAAFLTMMMMMMMMMMLQSGSRGPHEP